MRGCQGKVWRKGYGSIGRGKLWERGARGESYHGKQGLNCTPGVSAESVGSQAIWLGDASSAGRADQGPSPREPRDCTLLPQRR